MNYVIPGLVATLASDQVGMFRDANTGNQMWVDWARLDVTADAPADVGDRHQEVLNDAANHEAVRNSSPDRH